VGQDAALEERLDFIHHEARQAASALISCVRFRQEGPPMLCEDLVENRLLRPMARVGRPLRGDTPGFGERNRAWGRHPESLDDAVRRFRFDAGDVESRADSRQSAPGTWPFVGSRQPKVLPL
jgi:hypothetical protein